MRVIGFSILSLSLVSLLSPSVSIAQPNNVNSKAANQPDVIYKAPFKSNGTLTEEQFRKAEEVYNSKGMERQVLMDSVMERFNSADINGDGVISADEIAGNKAVNNFDKENEKEAFVKQPTSKNDIEKMIVDKQKTNNPTINSDGSVGIPAINANDLRK